MHRLTFRFRASHRHHPIGALVVHRLTRSIIGGLFVVAVLMCATAPPARGQAPLIPREQHQWAKFRPGAWRTVRTVIETFDASGSVTSTNTLTTTTTLQRSNLRFIQLRDDRVVMLSGIEINEPLREIQEEPVVRLVSAAASVQDHGPASVVVDGKRIAARVISATSRDRLADQTEEIYYSDESYPFVLKRISLRRDRESDTQVSDTTFKVISLNRRQPVLGITTPVTEAETVRQDTKGITTTKTIVSMDVPGGLVSEVTEERVGETLIRRTTQELVGFGGKLRPLAQLRARRQQALEGSR